MAPSARADGAFFSTGIAAGLADTTRSLLGPMLRGVGSEIEVFPSVNRCTAHSPDFHPGAAEEGLSLLPRELNLTSPMKIISLLIAFTILASPVDLRAVDKDAPKAAAPAAFKNVNAEEFDKLRTEKDHVVLDVRTPKEFAAGHIADAKNIDWNSPDFAQEAARLDPSKTYLIHCAGGVRSAKAADKLSKLNFKCVNLEGGLKAWEKAGKPVQK